MSYPPTNPRINPPPLPGIKRVSQMFYKTRICRKFTEGTCEKGEGCTYAHGADDLHKPPPNWEDYIHGKNKSGGNNSISSREEKSIIRQMKICYKFYYGKPCPSGENCSFLHQRLRRFDPQFEGDMQVDSSRRVENEEFEGDVSGRRESTVIHINPYHSTTDLWKTKLCSKWESGQCPYGERCHYAHGISDLKVPDADASVEAESGLSFVPAPVDPLPSYPPTIAPAEEKNKLKWKVGRKISGIYGDWIGDGLPYDYSSDEGNV